MVRRLALALIRLYQHHLSPRKGFSCAYRAHTGRASCSALGWRAVRRHGVLRGLALIRERTRRCGVAHRRYGPAARPLHGQQGVCDAGCDLPVDAHCHSPCDGPCDGPGPRGGRRLSQACDVAECCGCDWSSRDRRSRHAGRERSQHLPPRR